MNKRKKKKKKFQAQNKLLLFSRFFFFFRLHKYIPHSRNILRTRDLDYRLNHLKNGRIPIVSFLSELPQTEHDPQSFGVDLTLFSVKNKIIN